MTEASLRHRQAGSRARLHRLPGAERVAGNDQHNGLISHDHRIAVAPRGDELGARGGQVARRFERLGADASAFSGKFAANGAWLTCAVIAHNLTRALGVLAAGHHHSQTTATIRRQLINTPARASRSALRLTLHLPTHWPWQPGWTRLWHSPAPTLNPESEPPRSGSKWKSRADRRTSHGSTRNH